MHPLANLVRINQQRRFGLQKLCQVADLVTVRLLTILRAPSAALPDILSTNVKSSMVKILA